eukprot:6041186-Lingulodinium_polyedra.AAC.1
MSKVAPSKVVQKASDIALRRRAIVKCAHLRSPCDGAIGFRRRLCANADKCAAQQRASIGRVLDIALR